MAGFVGVRGGRLAYNAGMLKNAENRILHLPQGNPTPWVNFVWMLVFSPFLLLLGAVAIGGLCGIAYVLFEIFFK